MDFQTKLQTLGFDPDLFKEINIHLEDALYILALIEPMQAYCFYQHHIEEKQIQDIAVEIHRSIRDVNRKLNGDKDELGAEDWFIVILQLVIEVHNIDSDASKKLFDCFLPCATGKKTPLQQPFHSAFFLLLIEAMIGDSDLMKLNGSLPWRNTKITPPTVQMQYIVWPCFHSPLKHNQLPGLFAVLKECSIEDELFWMCLIMIHLFLEKDSWFKLLSFLNARNPMLIKCHKKLSLIIVHNTQNDICDFLKNLPEQWMQYAAIGILSKTPYSWDILLSCLPASSASHLEGIAANKRVEECAIRMSESLSKS